MTTTRPAMPLAVLLTELGPDAHLVDDEVDVDHTAVEWAHVSEMVDPTRWLRGGELLLLTGLMLPTDAVAMAEYVRRLSAAGIAALGISTGPSLALRSIPTPLVDAAAAVGLPLVSIAERLPLEKVVETVAAYASREQIAAARSTARVQRALSRSLSHGAPAGDVLGIVETEFGVSALVCSPAGAPLIAPSGPDTEARRALSQYTSASAPLACDALHATDIGAERIELHAVELDRQFVGGYLALAGTHPFDTAMREAIPLLVSAVSRTLLPPATGDPHHLAWRVECARWVFASSVPDADIDARLIAAGYQDTLVRAATIHGDFTPDVGRNLARYYFESQCDVLLAHPRSRRVDCLLLNPSAGLRTDHGVRGVSVALGAVTGQSSVSRTLRSAAAAASTDAVSQDPALAQLLTAVTAEDRAAFARTVLGDLATAPGDLVTTLRVYLDALGAMEVAAARLAVHRHTVRHRLRRITEIAGRNPDDPRQRTLFALALDMDVAQANHDATLKE